MADPTPTVSATETTRKFEDAVRGASDAMETFSNAGFKNSTILKDMNSSFNSAEASVGNFIGALTTGLSANTGFTAALTGTLNALSNVVGVAYESVKAYDAMDSGLRTFAKDQFQLAAGIGATFEESEKFAKSYRKIIEANSELSREGLYIGSQDVKNVIGVMQKAGITIDQLGETTAVTVGGLQEHQISYAQTMAAQAEAMGMSVEAYSGKMATMVRKSGLSMQDSMKLMAASQDIARNTGLTVDEVTASLDGATSSFQRMGTTIDFGRPILKGFADSLKDVGLGVAQAGDLTTAFSQSLLKIVDSPALAYITSLKGGFGAAAGGTGGVLAPSIQMQSQMMDQTPGSQAELARNLSEGMRETLKSFTGGDIITVKEAAASPELSTQFYTQQKMLGSTYGISDSATQNRVLEYLSQLEDATYAGDDETAKMLQKQIQEATTANDKTMSLQEKMSQDIEKSKMLIDEQVQLMKVNLKTEFNEQNYGEEWKKMYTMLDTAGGDVSASGGKYDTQAKSYADLNDAIKKANDRRAGTPPDTGGAQMTKENVGDSATGGARPSPVSQPMQVSIVLIDKTGKNIGIESSSLNAVVPAVK
jgi:hypothetical protein